MNRKDIFNLFTKSVLQGILDKVGGKYKTSWKKDKLIELLCDFDLKTVLNKMSTKQLKVVLNETKLSNTGKKSALIDRIVNSHPTNQNSIKSTESVTTTSNHTSTYTKEYLYALALSVAPWLSDTALEDWEENHLDWFEGEFDLQGYCPLTLVGVSLFHRFHAEDRHCNYRHDTFIFKDKNSSLIFAIEIYENYRGDREVSDPVDLTYERSMMPVYKFTLIDKNHSFVVPVSDCGDLDS